MVSVYKSQESRVSILKHYDLDRIIPLLKNCKEYFDNLALAYRVQGFKITDEFKKLRSDVTEQIIKIEGDSCEEDKYKR